MNRKAHGRPALGFVMGLQESGFIASGTGQQ
jgi:hypothetical protein